MDEMYRQGDLLFVRADKIPTGAQRRPNGLILEGEATGHSHRVEHGAHVFTHNVKSTDVLSEALYDEQLFVDVLAPEAEVVHEEHATIVLPQGVFEVIRQREWTAEDNARLVVD